MSHNGRQRKAPHPSQHLVGLNNGGWRTGSVDCQRTDGQRRPAQDATRAQLPSQQGASSSNISPSRERNHEQVDVLASPRAVR